MASVNKVILVGNLGRDPELKYTPSGMAIATFTVATTSGGGRDREPQTEWHKIVVFDKQAEQCSQYLTKGRQVYIDGRLQTRSWDDKQTGQKRSTTEIVANQVVFLGGGDRQQGAGGPRPQRDMGDGGGYGGAPRNAPPQRGGGYGGGGGYEPAPEVDDMPPSTFNEDDDIPF
jgi:single-strand DNA-binding protein